VAGVGSATGTGVGVGPSVASVGIGSGTTGVDAISAQDDRLLRLFLANVQFADNAMASSLTTTQTASLLYRSGRMRAAKELLCDEREVYDAFRKTASPCAARATWELKDTLSLRSTANAPMTMSAFRASAYRSTADCLTAAYTAGVPLSSCERR
jgi:hypothetical protein